MKTNVQLAVEMLNEKAEEEIFVAKSNPFDCHHSESIYFQGIELYNSIEDEDDLDEYEIYNLSVLRFIIFFQDVSKTVLKLYDSTLKK